MIFSPHFYSFVLTLPSYNLFWSIYNPNPCSVFLKSDIHVASYPNISMWQASTFSCQSQLQASTHYSVIGADEKKTVTPILMWTFGNSSAAPSIKSPSAWQSCNNTNRCDFQMQNDVKLVVGSHALLSSQQYKMRQGDVPNNKIDSCGYSILSKTDFKENTVYLLYF